MSPCYLTVPPWKLNIRDLGTRPILCSHPLHYKHNIKITVAYFHDEQRALISDMIVLSNKGVVAVHILIVLIDEEKNNE